MSDINPKDFQFERNIHLSRVEQTLAQSGAERSGVAPREWVRQALVHYERWQELWEGPTPSPDDHASEVELFATLVENSPECLRGQWRHLHDMVRLNKALWVWPAQSVEEFELGFEPTLPYLDRAALAKAWPRLRAVVSDMMARASVVVTT
jgi:hypothetical protein